MSTAIYAVEKRDGAVEYDDVISRARGINWADLSGAITFTAQNSATAKFMTYNNGAATTTTGASNTHVNNFIIRKCGGFVKMSGMLTAATAGFLITGGSPTATTGETGWVTMFTITNAASTATAQRQLFPLFHGSQPKVVAFGSAVIADKALKVTTASASAVVVQNTASGATSIYANFGHLSFWRIYVSNTVASAQLFVPASVVIDGQGTSVTSNVPKVLLCPLEYPCIDPRANNLL